MRHSVARHEGAGHRLCRRVLSTRSQGPREQSFRSTTPTLRYGEIGASAAAADARGFRWRRAHASARSPKAKPGPASTAPPSTATGIRTRVSAMRGRRPSPLDDSGAKSVVRRLAKLAEPVPGGPAAAGPARPAPPGTPPLRYLRLPRGCGGIGRRARFRSVSGKPGGGSSPLIRIARRATARCCTEHRPRRSKLAQHPPRRSSCAGGDPRS